jgi:hypothetical protein
MWWEEGLKIMKSFNKIVIIALLAVAALPALWLSSSHVATAATTSNPQVQSKTQPQSQAQNNTQKSGKQASSNSTYSYTAQDGDSYSLIARKAIQTFGLKMKVSLSQAKIIFAETKLTQAAGSPDLTVGQKITVKESDVKNWVDQAKKLTSTQEQAWAYYAQFADFNTNNVGEAK